MNTFWEPVLSRFRRRRTPAPIDDLHRLIDDVEGFMEWHRHIPHDDLSIWGGERQQCFDDLIRRLAAMFPSKGAIITAAGCAQIGAATRQAQIENRLMWAAWEQRRYVDRASYERRIVQRLETCLEILARAAARRDAAPPR